MKTRSNVHFKALTAQQVVLFPSNIGERIPSNHPVLIVNQVVDSLNIDEILSDIKVVVLSLKHRVIDQMMVHNK